MLQMLWKSGDTEKVVDLVEVPELVLVQFCDIYLRKRDLSDPQNREILRETANALKVKAEKPPDSPHAYSRSSLKELVANIEGLLDKFDKDDG